jgi:hypothetical protein
MIDTNRLQRLLHQLQRQPTVPQAAQVAASIAQWFGYYRYLQIVLERYQEAETAYTAALQRLDAQGQHAPRERPPSRLAGTQDLAALQALATEWYTAMDHVCQFAKNVLDGVADTFQGYFALAWDTVEHSYARLLSNFTRLCQEKQYLLHLAYLQGDMQAVHDHLAAHTPAGARPMPQSALLELPHETEKFTRFVTLLDRYIDAMVQFLEVNVAHSILHRAPSPPEMSEP